MGRVDGVLLVTTVIREIRSKRLLQGNRGGIEHNFIKRIWYWASIRSSLMLGCSLIRKPSRKQHHSVHRLYERLVEEHGFRGRGSSARHSVQQAKIRLGLHGHAGCIGFEPDVGRETEVDWGVRQPASVFKTRLNRGWKAK